VKTPLNNKSSIKEIKERFDDDVERFSNLETAQQTIIDAALMMDLLANAAAATTPHAKRLLDIGCGASNNTIKKRIVQIQASIKKGQKQT
jgi:tRNA (cmo5U34)-methyltransferase